MSIQPAWTKVGAIPEEVVAHCRRSVSVNDFTRMSQNLRTGNYEIFVLTKYVKEI